MRIYFAIKSIYNYFLNKEIVFFVLRITVYWLVCLKQGRCFVFDYLTPDSTTKISTLNKKVFLKNGHWPKLVGETCVFN